MWIDNTEEKEAEEMRAKAEIEAAFATHDEYEDYDDDEVTYDDYSQNCNHSKHRNRHNRRIQKARNKKHMQRIAEVMAASYLTRMAYDMNDRTYRDRSTGKNVPRKSKILRADRIMKKADKVPSNK